MIDLDDSRAPWLPPGLGLPRVGDRVVVRLGGECDQGHGVVQDGDTGVVIDGSWIPWGAPPSPGHQVCVELDVARSLGQGRRQRGVMCAAIELEILADDDE